MKQLRNEKGQFMKQECPDCGANLQEEYGELICTNLVCDPNNVLATLFACDYTTLNGVHVKI